MRVLVAEDDASLRRVLHSGLVEAGYVVDAAADGDEALRYLKAHEYGAVILDWRMPKTSGRDVLAIAKPPSGVEFQVDVDPFNML